MAAAANPHSHLVTDTLHLWWLGQPEQPVYVGELRTVRATRGVSLRYAPGWLKAGFALSEDLPLIDTEFLPTERDRAVGAVDDARPDRWGELVEQLIAGEPVPQTQHRLLAPGTTLDNAISAHAQFGLKLRPRSARWWPWYLAGSRTSHALACSLRRWLHWPSR